MITDLNYDILSVSDRAKKDLANGNNIINGSIGVLLDENKKIVSFEGINKIIKKNLEKYLDYSTMLGREDFNEGILSWIFEDKLDYLKSKNNLVVAATSGGTDAIFTLFSILKKSHTALLPNIHWPNYDQIAKQAGINLKTFSRFKNNNSFNFDDLEKTILNIEGKILLSINDPCHNPTGYCLSDEEYIKLFELVNKYEDKIDLLLDIAYIDYSSKKAQIISFISKNNLKSNLYLAISCSKSFGFYGLRLGALCLISKGETNEIKNNIKATIRGTISSANNVAMGSLAEFFNNKNDKESVKTKILIEGNRVNKIGKSLYEILSKKGFEVLPYKEGFFLTFKMKNAKEFLKKLEEKHIYFTLSDEETIRIAICSLSIEDLKVIETEL